MIQGDTSGFGLYFNSTGNVEWHLIDTDDFEFETETPEPEEFTSDLVDDTPLGTFHSSATLHCGEITIEQIPSLEEAFEELMKEERREKKMELINIYEKNAKKAINEKYEKIIKNELENHPSYKRFAELTSNFEKEMDSLYAETLDEFGEETTIRKRYSSNDYMYSICNLAGDIRERHLEEFNNEMESLNKMLEEVNAQVSLIENTSNDYDKIQNILFKYNIINVDGKVAEYGYDSEKVKNDIINEAVDTFINLVLNEDEEEKPKAKKRGRKPKKVQE